MWLLIFKYQYTGHFFCGSGEMFDNDEKLQVL
jgi:hypothetical protein